jgi:membrane protease YdiL (CAAX protease family)
MQYKAKMHNEPSSLMRTFRAFDTWISLGACFSIQLFGARLLVPPVKRLAPSLSWVTISYGLTIIAFVIPLTYLMRRYGRIRHSDLILRAQDLVVLLLASLVLFLFASLYVLKYGIRVSPALAQVILNLPRSEYFLVVVIILIVVPILEETFFRRYILEIFRNKYRLPIAIILTVGSETFLHLGYDVRQLVIIFIYGLGLTAVYLKSRLSTAIIMHCFINFLFSVPL